MTDNKVEVETFNGRSYYSLDTPAGQRWSWDEEDLDEGYIVDSLFAWSRLLDFVKERNDAS